MKAVYIIESEKLKPAAGKRQTKIKLSYLHYPVENATFTFNYLTYDYVDLIEDLFADSDIKIIAYAYNAKKKNYLFVVDNVINLKELKNQLKLSEKVKGRAKDYNNYNRAEKWETPLKKRKVPARNARKTTRKR